MGVFLQLWTDQFFPYYDYKTLWDAVATIPKAEVVGTGMVLLSLSLIASMLSAGVGWLTFSIFHKQPTVDEELTAGCGNIDPCTPCVCERLSTPSDEGYARSMLRGSTTH